MAEVQTHSLTIELQFASSLLHRSSMKNRSDAALQVFRLSLLSCP